MPAGPRPPWELSLFDLSQGRRGCGHDAGGTARANFSIWQAAAELSPTDVFAQSVSPCRRGFSQRRMTCGGWIGPQRRRKSGRTFTQPAGPGRARCQKPARRARAAVEECVQRGSFFFLNWAVTGAVPHPRRCGRPITKKRCGETRFRQPLQTNALGRLPLTPAASCDIRKDYFGKAIARRHPGCPPKP